MMIIMLSTPVRCAAPVGQTSQTGAFCVIPFQQMAVTLRPACLHENHPEFVAILAIPVHITQQPEHVLTASHL